MVTIDLTTPPAPPASILDALARRLALTLPELRALYPEDHLEEFSANTPKTVLELFNMVQVDRERGYVLGEGFFEASISTIAAPVRDHTGHVVAALGSTIPAAQIDPDRIEGLVTRVRAAADEISGLLNYQPRQGAGSVVSLPRAR